MAKKNSEGSVVHSGDRDPSNFRKTHSKEDVDLFGQKYIYSVSHTARYEEKRRQVVYVFLTPENFTRIIWTVDVVVTGQCVGIMELCDVGSRWFIAKELSEDRTIVGTVCVCVCAKLSVSCGIGSAKS